jgi:transposase
MSDEPRLLRPDRRQLRFDMVDLESQLPEDHIARIVWAFVETLDVSPLEAGIKSLLGGPGRPTPERRLYLAIWLLATLDGVGSAREVDRLCKMHTAYRWLCGGVPVNYHDLADFRVEAGEFLDGLLSKSVAALVAQDLVALDCLAVDSVRVRASASASSFRREHSLTELHEAAKAKVAALRSEIDDDPGAASRRLTAARLRAASARADKIAAAKAALKEIEAERAKEGTRRKKKRRKEPRASTTDSEARIIKTDGGFRPGYNFQIRTDPKSGIIVGFEATNRASDRGQLTPAVEDIEKRYGARPKQVLADGGYDGKGDIQHLYNRDAIEVFCPLPGSKGGLGDPTPKRGDKPGIIAWRKRMSCEEGLAFYRRRFATERPHADMRNRGLTRLLVRGLKKVKAAALWYVTTYNFLQSRFLMAQAAQAQPA